MFAIILQKPKRLISNSSKHFETGLVSEVISFLKMFAFLSSFDWQDISCSLDYTTNLKNIQIFTNQTIRNKQTRPVRLALIGWWKFKFVVLELFVYLKNWKERNKKYMKNKLHHWPAFRWITYFWMQITDLTNKQTNKQTKDKAVPPSELI